MCRSVAATVYGRCSCGRLYFCQWQQVRTIKSLSCFKSDVLSFGIKAVEGWPTVEVRNSPQSQRRGRHSTFKATRLSMWVMHQRVSLWYSHIRWFFFLRVECTLLIVRVTSYQTQTIKATSLRVHLIFLKSKWSYVTLTHMAGLL